MLLPVTLGDLGFFDEAHGSGFHSQGPHGLVQPAPHPVAPVPHFPVPVHNHQVVPLHHHPAPPVHHDPYHHHVPGFLEVHHDDYGHSDIKYDYGYGHRNHLQIPVGHHLPRPHHLTAHGPTFGHF